MHQPLIGAAFPLLIALCCYARRRGRASLRLLVITPLAMAAGAVWAVLPDLPRLVGAHGLYRRLAGDPRTDLFFWHYTIDRIETALLDRLTPLYGLLLAGMLGLLLLAAWLELRRAEGPSTGEGS